jgi:hypothetical protein
MLGLDEQRLGLPRSELDITDAGAVREAFEWITPDAALKLCGMD